MAATHDPRIPDLVNAMEAARMLGLSRQAVTKIIESGQLPARRVGRVWLMRRVVVERYAKARALVDTPDDST